MLLRLVPRGRVGRFPGFSPPSSQRASLALRGTITAATTTTTTYPSNLKHQHRTLIDNRRGLDGVPEWQNSNRKQRFVDRDPERDLPDSQWALHGSEWAVPGPLSRTVKCLSVVINPEAWEHGISGGPLGAFSKRTDPRNPRWFISPVINNYFQNISPHGLQVRPDCIVILASLRFFQEVQSPHPFLFNTINEVLPRTEMGPVTEAEVIRDKLNVVTAVVDKIPLWQVPGHAPSARLASEGFSILCGQTEDLLPGLWDNSKFSWSNFKNETDPLFKERMWHRLPMFSGGGYDSGKVTRPMPYSSGPPPVLEFRINPLRGDNRPVQVTLPLANTSYATSTSGARYQQTTPHILEVSAWARSLEKQKLRPIHVEANTRTHVTIQTTSLKQQQQQQQATQHGTTNLWFQLVAITSPRKIVSGLGNILKRVEIDGESVPASKELEDTIPKLVSMRASSKRRSKRPKKKKKKEPESDGHTVKVWALIIPDEVYRKYTAESATSRDVPMGAKLPRVFNIEGASTRDEKKLAGMSTHDLGALLIAGCEIREILSGGGGWGAKQGLLSLDPQDRRDNNRRQPLTSTGDAEDDDAQDMAALDRFLRTLRGEQNVGDIASPGSWVQFFVAPVPAEKMPWERQQEESDKNLANVNDKDSDGRIPSKRKPVFETLILGSTDAATEEYVPEWDPKFMEKMDPAAYRFLWRDPNGVQVFKYQFGALAAGEDKESSLWLAFKKPGEEVKATVTTKTSEDSTVWDINHNDSSGNDTDINRHQEEQQDLWKDLETDAEIKITIPEFSLRADIENPLYRREIRRQPGEVQEQQDF